MAMRWKVSRRCGCAFIAASLAANLWVAFGARVPPCQSFLLFIYAILSCSGLLARVPPWALSCICVYVCRIERRRTGKGNSLVRVARVVHKGVRGGRGAIYLPAMNSAAFQRSGSTCPLSSSRSRSRSPSCRRRRPSPPPSSPRTATPADDADDDGAASTRRKTSRHRGCARSSGVSTRATNRGPRRADARIR